MGAGSARARAFAEGGPQRDALGSADHDHVDGLARTMVLQGERHVVQVFDARARHLDDAIALAHARAIGGTTGPGVGEQHAARLLLHRPVVGHGPEIGAVTAAVAFARRWRGRARVDGNHVAAGHLGGEDGRELGDAGRALRVERGRLVLGAVVLLV